MFYDFQTTTHGKWILVGEHAVLRGHGALVFPISEKKLTLNYQSSSSKLSADFEGSNGADLHLLFWSVLEQGQQLINKSLNDLNGHFYLQSNIPLGTGMGASAALCVAVARWFDKQNLLTQPIYSFAQKLENLFHGTSSGLDIAGVNAKAGIFFQQGQVKQIQPSWKPAWFLSSCGQASLTAHCIQQVTNFWQNDPTSAAILDEKMGNCATKARFALEQNDPKRLTSLASAIQGACDCFNSWGLINENLQQHMQSLMKLGALAVKPTGSGKGGHVLSLWEKPPEDLPIDLLSI